MRRNSERFLPESKYNNKTLEKYVTNIQGRAGIAKDAFQSLNIVKNKENSSECWTVIDEVKN